MLEFAGSSAKLAEQKKGKPRRISVAFLIIIYLLENPIALSIGGYCLANAHLKAKF
jgi:hypothetical protein